MNNNEVQRKVKKGKRWLFKRIKLMVSSIRFDLTEVKTNTKGVNSNPK